MNKFWQIRDCWIRIQEMKDSRILLDPDPHSATLLVGKMIIFYLFSSQYLNFYNMIYTEIGPNKSKSD